MTTNITDITDGSPDGTGVFDLLMKSFKAHITIEYDKNRLKGTDYASVYLGAVQTAMQQAIQFELTKAQVAAQTDLLLEQINTEAATTLGIIKDNLVKDQQILSAIAQVALVEQQVINLTATGLNIPKQGIVLDKQADQLDAQIALSIDQSAKIVAETEVITEQGGFR